MGTPSIYVGTYGKYTNGTIEGKWLKPSDYSDIEEFYEACKELHDDEEDPEFMFQDWEYIPDCLIGESSLSAKLWDYMEAMNDIDNSEAFETYVNLKGYDFSKDDIDTVVSDFTYDFMGEYNSEKEFGEYWAEENGMYERFDKAGISLHYFDEEAYTRDLFLDGFTFDNGFVFQDT